MHPHRGGPRVGRGVSANLNAAHALETGAGTVHERLFEAFTHLVLVRPEDMPDGELRPAFCELMAALTSEEPKGIESRLVATLKVIGDEHAQDIARAINKRSGRWVEPKTNHRRLPSTRAIALFSYYDI